MSPEELTRLNMDKSALLRRLIEEYGGEALMLLGELQVSISQTLYSMSLSRTKILRCCGAWGEPCSMCIASRIGTRSGQLVIMQDWKHSASMQLVTWFCSWCTAGWQHCQVQQQHLMGDIFLHQTRRLPGHTLCRVQFALLAFLLGHSLEAFGQWKALLHLLLSCEEAPFRTHSSFYAQALNAVHAQLSHCLASSR